MAAGIGLVPEDRRQQGLVMSSSITRNIALASLRRLSRLGFIRGSMETTFAADWAIKLQMRYGRLANPVSSLSGGNQQKVVIAKSLIQKPKLVIFDEPTRGVDVGAIVEIHRFINELADDGIAVVVISSYLPEVLALSDRILIARQGRIVEEMDISEATEAKIMYAAVH